MVYNTHWVILCTTYSLLPEQTLRILARILIIVMEPKMQCSGGHWASQFDKWQYDSWCLGQESWLNLFVDPPCSVWKIHWSGAAWSKQPALPFYMSLGISKQWHPVGGLKVRKDNLKVRTKLPKKQGKMGFLSCFQTSFFCESLWLQEI